MRTYLLNVVLWSAFLTIAAAGVAWAHVEVSPTEVTPGSAERFTVDVAGEKEVPAIEVRLEVPQGFEVTEVSSPSGWEGRLEDGSLVWSGGELAQDRAAEFAFDARAPEEEGEFVWNGFVTYADESIVEWTGFPNSENPASVVAVGSGGSGAGGHDDDHSAGAESAKMPDTGGPNPVFFYGIAGLVLLATGLALLRKNLS